MQYCLKKAWKMIFLSGILNKILHLQLFYAMKIKPVPRSEIKVSRKSTSKFQPLIDALNKLEKGGDALQVTYSSEKELGSMRNVVYTYMRTSGTKIKSRKDASTGNFYLWRE